MIDGDTIVVSGDVHVRLIGVDTPETNAGVELLRARRHPVHERASCPPGSKARLVYDVERLDRYGRTLAYVYKLTDGVFVNLAVARNGFAVQLTVPAERRPRRGVPGRGRRGPQRRPRPVAGLPATTTTVPVREPVPLVAAPTTTKVTTRRSRPRPPPSPG